MKVHVGIIEVFCAKAVGGLLRHRLPAPLRCLPTVEAPFPNVRAKLEEEIEEKCSRNAYEREADEEERILS